MAFEIRRVDYFNTRVEDYAGAAAKLLTVFAGAGISLLAFKADPLEPAGVRFTLFPDDSSKMIDGAKRAGVELDGPFPALLIQGNDESGALAGIYERLSRADIKPNGSNGIAGINGGYGVILHLTEEDCEKAEAALKM